MSASDLRCQKEQVLAVARHALGLAYVGSTLVTADSYDLSMRLGGGAAFSGAVMGTTSSGFFVGTACWWLIGRRWPYYWLHAPRLVQGAGIALGFASALMLIAVAAAAGTADEAGWPNTQDAVAAPEDVVPEFSIHDAPLPPEFAGLPMSALRIVLLACQLLYGMSVACYFAMSMQLQANVAAPADRPFFSGLQTECAMIGVGMGPVVAGGAHAARRALAGGPRCFVVVGAARLVLCTAIAALLVIRRLPNLRGLLYSEENVGIDPSSKDCQEDMDDDGEVKPLRAASLKSFDSSGGSSKRALGSASQNLSCDVGKAAWAVPPWATRVRIIGVVLVASCLHFMVSGLEVASVMVLEVEFGWTAPDAGLLVGGTFLGGLPLRRLLDRAKGQSAGKDGAAAMVRWLLLINGGSCVLLFRQLCVAASSRVACVVMLLLADLLFYGSVMFTVALLRGLALQCVQRPGEGPFDIANFMMAWACAVDMLARTFGAPLARGRLASSAGRDGYALQQLVVLAFAWVLAEATALRPVDSRDAAPMAAAVGARGTAGGAENVDESSAVLPSLVGSPSCGAAVP